MPETQPRTFGTYTVEHELGRGGMGIVYAATHEVLGRRAAIKVLLNDVSRDGDLVQRFMNEARAASAIQHPSIVQVFEVGQAGDAVYIVMELLHGETLAARLKSGAMPIATAIGLARQCANALAAAHHAGIVHRDLKPDNVFLVPDAEVLGGERVKLLDFGVAKLVGGDGTSSVARTVTGAILGTPHYMSPEQCEGAREVDPRSDLYSLGCMLFQMVAGRLPFNSAGIGGLIGMHLHVEPPLLCSLRPDAPPELEALVSRLLAKSPDDRVQSATEVASILSELPAASVRTSAPMLPTPAPPTVEAGTATIMTVAESISSPRITEKAPAPPSSIAKRRRWMWPALALAAIGITTLAVVAIRSSDGNQEPRALSVAQEPTPQKIAPSAPAIDPDLAESKLRLAKRDFDGAFARAVVVLERDPKNADAAKVLAEARQGRALLALDGMRESGKQPADIKRSLDVVYENTDDGNALRAEADHIWASAKPKPQAQVSKKPPPVQVAKAPPPQAVDQGVLKRQRRAVEIVKMMGFTNEPILIANHCFELTAIAPGSVPWERCVDVICKQNNPRAQHLISLSPFGYRARLRQMCPIASRPPNAPRPNAPNNGRD